MRKQILVLVTVIGFLFVSGLPGHAKDFNKYFKNGHGNIPNLGNLKAFDLAKPKKFVKKPSPDDPAVDLYVNGATGKDSPSWGDSPEKPFKTIGYAISRVPFMRDSSDFYANINIAEGIYEESLTIELDRIGLYGAGSDNTQVVGSEEVDTIHVLNSDNIVIDALKIVNGLSGIAFEGSSGIITDMTVIDCVFNGILVHAGSNFVLKDCFVKDTSGVFGFGLHVSDSSQAFLMGDVSFVSNYMFGIAVYNNGSVLLNPGANVTVSGSTSAGLYTMNCSGIFLFDSSFSAVDNNIGILLTANSSLVISHGEIILEGNNTGAQIDQSSTLTVGLLGKLTVQDNNNAGLLVDGGTISFVGGGNSIIDNGQDFILGFGARATFWGDDEIGSINCDDTVLIRGNQTCP